MSCVCLVMVLNRSQVLGSGTSLTNSTKSDGWPTFTNLQVIELIGSDRPGLITDMCTALLDKSQMTDVNVKNWYDKHCSVVTIQCPDRPRLLFDTICTLTDMGYVVLHGHAKAESTEAFQSVFSRPCHAGAVLCIGGSRLMLSEDEKPLQKGVEFPRSKRWGGPSSGRKKIYIYIIYWC
ncbi:putative ACT domain-containing protein ACR1-12 [Helianthus anomalus]